MDTRTSPTQSYLQLSSTAFDFKSVVVGQTATQKLTLANAGKTPLRIASFSLSNKEFTITGPSLPRYVLPAQSLAYTLSFTPVTSGNFTASIVFQTDSPGLSSVSLAGVGEKAFAALQLTPASINFGNLALQSTSTQNVTVQNTGDISFTINGVTVAGTGFGYSNLSPGFSLAPNQKVTFQVWFRPQVSGAATGTVSLLSASLASPDSLPLSGQGVTSATSTPAVQHTVTLSWDAPSAPVAGYHVYRSELATASYSLLFDSLVTTASYLDSTVVDGVTYDYVVTSVDNSGAESAYSNPAVAVIPSP